MSTSSAATGTTGTTGTSGTTTTGTTPDAASRTGSDQAAGRRLDPAPVGVRTRLAGLWAAMLFVFAYVDLFSFYRPDFRAAVEAGTVSGFTVGQGFLLGTTAYIVLPSLMVYLVLVLPPQVNRVANIVLAVLYAVTIVAGAIGEWQYYVLGSVVEVALLALVVRNAWAWPKQDDQAA
ncbi:DUF6326 family protein [Kineosporia sp. A_224]|uniref:DUF6326 family protein n=1 Tax=Kineosporia sp. A_224 TaxID=1962180 RepID=UPI000B4B2689|nr:DUF6326 family protein [Kineosporia sp. A_224]